MKIEQRLAVITGASRGIGAATAHEMAARGATVILLARTQADLDAEVAKIAEKGGKAYAYALDMTDAAAIDKVAERIIADHGVPDILLNNAGVGRWLFAEETPLGEEEMMIRLPYLGAFQITRAFLPGMLKRGSGHIGIVNSPVCLMVWRGASAYASARWALRGFAQSLRIDLEGTGIGVSHFVLGRVDSAYFETNEGTSERVPKIDRMVPRLTTEQAGKIIVNAIRRNRREVTKPFMLRVFRFFNWITPGIVRYVVRKTSYQRPK
ncbi:MAG: SDR family oxidoreductase [Bacteroidota bacterium]